jgi:transcriptional regulator with XRE-family HTH domain
MKTEAARSSRPAGGFRSWTGPVSVEREDDMPTLRETREERGWSPEALAARCGVPADVIADLEAGRHEHVTPEVAQSIAGAMGLDASTVYELRPSLGLSALGETGSGEGAKTGAGEPGESP